MSLEQQLERFNTNVEALIPLLKDSLSAVYGALGGVAQATAEPAAVNETPPPPARPAAKAPSKAPPKAVAPPAETGPTFDDVKRAVLKVASKSRQAAVDLLGRFGVTRVTELTEDQYSAVLAAAAKGA